MHPALRDLQALIADAFSDYAIDKPVLFGNAARPETGGLQPNCNDLSRNRTYHSSGRARHDNNPLQSESWTIWGRSVFRRLNSAGIQAGPWAWIFPSGSPPPAT